MTIEQAPSGGAQAGGEHAVPVAMAVGSEARTTVDSATFFIVVDAVLAETGRPALGERQRRIVEVRDDDVVLQILAGPGAGKTEVLVWRVLYELLVRGAEASRLLVTTFTRKAAQELQVRMVERSDAFLEHARRHGVEVDDPRVHDLRIGTIHSLCDQLLNEFSDEHLAIGAEVIDEVETRLRFLHARNWLFRDKTTGRQVLGALLDVPEVTALFKPPWLDADHLRTLNRVDLALTLLNQHIETWIPRCGEAGTPNGIELVHGITGLTDDLETVRRRWAAHLEQNHAMDYALLLKRFLERQPEIAPELDHIFVDEFQDTNPIQYAIHLGWVQHADARLTVVGDDDQALYRWRGSDIGCFSELGPECGREQIGYRQEVLEENNRSTKTIVQFARAFREGTVLASDSLPKKIVPPGAAKPGNAVRLLEGEWRAVCAHVAAEVDKLGAGRIIDVGQDAAPTVAILMASTSEVETKYGPRPAGVMRTALEGRGLRVYNPRNKAAARPGSPVHDLLGLISYLIDPVVRAPVGAPKSNGDRRLKEVWASCNDAFESSFAVSAPPGFMVSPDHAKIQKRVIKADGGAIGAPGPRYQEAVAFIDEVRALLIAAQEREIRMSLGGLVARLLTKPPFRSCGYTINLFRQALFTQLLEANVSVSRGWGRKSLEYPMVPRLDADGKIHWPQQYWQMLGAFGQLVEAGGQDDLEVEAFSEDAVALLTFHQAKGLEFDHVYVAMSGKEPDPCAALATELFSGRAPKYAVVDGTPKTKDKKILALAEADREREVYVAITRAKEKLSILHGIGDDGWAMDLNHGLAALFAGAASRQAGPIEIKEWKP